MGSPEECPAAETADASVAQLPCRLAAHGATADRARAVLDQPGLLLVHPSGPVHVFSCSHSNPTCVVYSATQFSWQKREKLFSKSEREALKEGACSKCMTVLYEVYCTRTVVQFRICFVSTRALIFVIGENTVQ